MKCQNAELLMMKYLDGELNEFEAESLNAHLKTCRACREAFEIYDTMAEEMRLEEAAQAPDGFEEEVMMKVAAAGKVYSPYGIWDKFKMRFAGSFVLIFCIGAMLLSGRERILEIFAANPGLAEKTKGIRMFAENIGHQTYSIAGALNNIFENVDRMLTSGSSFIVLSIAALCILQAYIVRRRNR